MALTGHVRHRDFYRPGVQRATTVNRPGAGNRATGFVRPTRLPAALAVGRRPFWREFALVAALLAFYNAGRIVASHNVGRAHSNARTLLHAEHWMHLPREQSLQSMVMKSRDLTECANWYYAHVHFPLTVAVLIWLWFRRPVHYLWARRALAVATTAGLLIIALVPTAPPRMMGNGFVDTGQLYGQSVYGAVGSDKLANQFAAMPSLHVGWAVLIATVCIKASTTRYRWLWIAHPVVTVLVVVSTANHYWLDGAVGALLTTTALYLNRNSLKAPQPQPRPHKHSALSSRVKTLWVTPAGRTQLAVAATTGEDVPAVRFARFGVQAGGDDRGATCAGSGSDQSRLAPARSCRSRARCVPNSVAASQRRPARGQRLRDC